MQYLYFNLKKFFKMSQFLQEEITKTQNKNELQISLSSIIYGSVLGIFALSAALFYLHYYKQKKRLAKIYVE